MKYVRLSKHLNVDRFCFRHLLPTNSVAPIRETNCFVGYLQVSMVKSLAFVAFCRFFESEMKYSILST